jgi:hypothetical protein
MSDPEEDPAGQSASKVHVQIGRFRPVSDRYPQVTYQRRLNRLVASANARFSCALSPAIEHEPAAWKPGA